MKRRLIKVMAIPLLIALIAGQALFLPQGFSFYSLAVRAEEASAETPETIIRDGRQELENRKAQKRFVLEDAYQGFYDQYLIGAQAAIDYLNGLDPAQLSVAEAKQKVEEAYAMEQEAFDTTFEDATQTSLLALDTLVKSMQDHATNEAVKEKIKDFSTKAQQSIRDARTLGDQITIVEPLRQTAFQKLGEFEREVLLATLDQHYEALKADGNKNEAELTAAYQAKKAEIEKIVINRSGIIDQSVPGKSQPTMGNYVEANQADILKALDTAADTPKSSGSQPPAETEKTAEPADLDRLKRYVADTTYTTAPEGYTPPYYIETYRNQYQDLIEAGNQILAQEKQTEKEVQAINARFKTLVDQIEEDAANRMGLVVALLGAPLTDEEGLRDYKPRSWDAYKPVLARAVAAVDNPDLGQPELDQIADELNDAIGALEGLANFHDLESTLKLWDNVPNYVDLYTTNTHPAFVTAYREAEAVNADRNNDQPTIDQALQQLKAAFDQLKTRVSKHENEAAIKKVHHDMGVNGDERNKLDQLSRRQYTPQTFDPFFALYEENLRLIADTTTSNEPENTAHFKERAQALLTAMGNLQRRAKTKALQDKVSEAKREIATDRYEESGIKKLQALVDEAETLLKDANVDQATVDAKRKAIEEAIGALVEKIDYSRLDEAIRKAQAIREDDLTGKSKADLADGIQAAQAVRNKKPVTQAEIEQAAQQLNDIIDHLQKQANKDALREKIDAVQKKDLNPYTPDSKAALERALEAAKQVIANTDATQDDVDQALAALEQAEAALTEKTKIDRTALDQLIREVEDGIQNRVPSSDLQKALDAAKAVLGDPTATQEAVNRAKDELQQAFDAWKQVKPSDPQAEKVDYSKLEVALEKVKKIDSSAYTEKSVHEMTDAVKHAVDIRNQADASQADVDAATDRLNRAIERLERKTDPIPAPATDKTKLKALVDEIETVVPSTDMGEDLKKTLQDAKKVLENEQATQADIDTAYQQLQTAFEQSKKHHDHTGTTSTTQKKPDESKQTPSQKPSVTTSTGGASSIQDSDHPQLPRTGETLPISAMLFLVIGLASAFGFKLYRQTRD